MLQQQLLTEGTAFSTLLRFSLPFLLSNILQACYGASDLFMVGRFADSISVSAVAHWRTDHADYYRFGDWD